MDDLVKSLTYRERMRSTAEFLGADSVAEGDVGACQVDQRRRGIVRSRTGVRIEAGEEIISGHMDDVRQIESRGSDGETTKCRNEDPVRWPACKNRAERRHRRRWVAGIEEELANVAQGS